MCTTLQRVMALRAMQTFLEGEIGRLRGEGAGPDEVSTRVDELAIVTDQLTAAVTDPHIVGFVASRAG